MHISNISPIGWLHSIACIVALAAGAAQLLRPKGTPSHVSWGRIYVLSMIVANGTALLIFRGDLVFRPGIGPYIGPVFGVFHWLAVITLVLLLLGWFAARHQRHAVFAYLHPICMIITYWFMLGATINQAFERVPWFQQMALAVTPGARGLMEYRLLAYFQFGLDVIILAMLIAAVIGVRRFRRQAIR
jgi:uncharacterized membrane protein